MYPTLSPNPVPNILPLLPPFLTLTYLQPYLLPHHPFCLPTFIIPSYFFTYNVASYTPPTLLSIPHYLYLPLICHPISPSLHLTFHSISYYPTCPLYTPINHTITCIVLEYLDPTMQPTSLFTFHPTSTSTPTLHTTFSRQLTLQ